jgi:hypothetical protein
MSSLTKNSILERWMPAISGCALIVAAFAVSAVVGSSAITSFGTEGLLVVSGCAMLAASRILKHPRGRLMLVRLSLTLVAILFTVAFAEIFFRVIRFDFESPPREIPIFNRPATYHIGGGILRRSGPASWRGKPISSLIHYVRGNENACADEPVMEINYDRLGFRNPPDQTDWEVVVAGDSFVESGYLPYEQIFTTVAAEKLEVQIKNLGVTGAGPIFETAYLRHYGKALSTKHAVLCFYDGNDVSDLHHELSETNFIAKTGHRVGAERQSSMLVAVYKSLTPPSGLKSARRLLLTNAVFVGAGRVYPAAFSPMLPPHWEELSIRTRESIQKSMADWAETAHAQGIQPWVMCIPDSRRVFAGHLRFVHAGDPSARWQATLFAPHLENLCSNLNIRFIDPYPALRREVEAGRTPYNLFGDLHLSVEGSRVVGEVLADALRPELRKSKQP